VKVVVESVFLLCCELVEEEAQRHLTALPTLQVLRSLKSLLSFSMAPLCTDTCDVHGCSCTHKFK
jgi:hypothetical protein